MSSFENNNESRERVLSEDLFSKVVSAGRRTYFFDVKATRNNDYYVVVTESRRIQGEGDNSSYDKRKLFLYKEDFDKFASGLREAIDFVRSNNPAVVGQKPASDSLSLDDEFEML